MARARNIKPSFFTNEQLADNCPLGRLLFIGLWTLADHKGDLEWKERTIKIQILPWDDCDIKKLAITLDKSGLIRFYSDGDKIYLNIINFIKHQNPHRNEKEKGSDIPAYSESFRQLIDLKELTINRDLSRVILEGSHSNPAESLIPLTDSPILKPESCNKHSESSAEASDLAFRGEVIKLNHSDFEKWKKLYPKIDLTRELKRLDLEFQHESPKNWFITASNKLNYQNKQSPGKTKSISTSFANQNYGETTQPEWAGV